ncbi:MAG TPA: cytidine deaminase [Sediminibacterium sp.]|nr:cytidine deaminase [Sediminibacterium sp.]
MEQQCFQFAYERYHSISELPVADADLLRIARETTQDAYAPYSRFRVGAAARMKNGEIIRGTNQENASYPAGICAERVLLSAAAALYPGVAVLDIAISYQSDTVASNRPVTPCGICRQSLVEMENRFAQSIRLILGGQTGAVWVIPESRHLLPMGFSGEDLGG